jgi:hypothetical protein
LFTTGCEEGVGRKVCKLAKVWQHLNKSNCTKKDDVGGEQESDAKGEVSPWTNEIGSHGKQIRVSQEGQQWGFHKRNFWILEA